MAFNNETGLPPNKRNLLKMNRLTDNRNVNTFDNAGFEYEKDKTPLGDWDTPLFQIEETYPQHEKRRSFDEAQSNTSRRILPHDPTKQTVINPKLFTDSTVSRSNVTESENIELKSTYGNSQQDNRKVLGSVNIKETSNTQDSESKDNDFTDSKFCKNGKASKMTFNVNLKRFETTSTNNTQAQDRLKLTRQVKTEDLSWTRRKSDVFSVVVAASKFSRSSSLRNPSRKPPRLLRDISFCDADDTDIKDYGSLKRLNLPRRYGTGPLSPDTVCILESLMHELVDRGKITQVVVIDLEESDVLASVPSGMFTKTDALGMTKSMICQASLFRLQVGDVAYSCFKHRQDAIQGRNDDLVMVMQMTKTCVVVGFSRDDCPGSCNSEVHEFAKVLEEADW